MPSYNTPKRGVAFQLAIGLVDQANTKLLKVNPTIAAGDFQISKDFGAFANLTTLPTVLPAGGRSVQINLSISEMTADNIVIQCVDAAGAEWCDQMINLQTTVSQLDDLATAANLALVNDKTTNLPTDPADQSLIIAATDAIMTRLGAPAGASLSADLATKPAASVIADAVWDEVVDGVTTARESMRLQNSALGGESSGLDTTTAVFRDLADTKARITATVDTVGNRTVVTRDLT